MLTTDPETRPGLPESPVSLAAELPAGSRDAHLAGEALPADRVDPLSRKRGQTMIEYVAIAAMLLGMVAILAVFLYTFREQGDRVLELVGYDYP